MQVMNNTYQSNLVSVKEKHTAQRLILYIAMASITMFFAVTTSALLVKKADVLNWAQFPLPSVFILSTVFAVTSSVGFFFSYKCYKEQKFSTSRWALFVSGLLGVAFLLSQFMGFESLKAMGLPLMGNVAGSFIYFLAIAHGAHIIGGLLALTVTLVNAYVARNDVHFEGAGNLNIKRLFSLEILTSYWHFVNVLWVYLFLFFYFNYQ